MIIRRVLTKAVSSESIYQSVVIRWFQTLKFAEQINQEVAREDQKVDSLLDDGYSVEKTSDTTEGNGSGM